MPQQLAVAVENNFTKGLITENTGLNFPENAATDTDNCEYTLVGEVLRRLGMDFEENFSTNVVTKTGKAVNTYKWNNAGGDGSSQLVVAQIGSIVYFYRASAATSAAPLSAQRLSSTVDLSTFIAASSSFDATRACEFTDGNGYLFIFHPSCDPIYCTYSANTVTGYSISLQIRDMTGIPETGVADNFRPAALTASHTYNLFNQGWTAQPGWSASSSETKIQYQYTPWVYAWTVQTGLVISASDSVVVSSIDAYYGPQNAYGTVVSYNSGTGLLTINVTTVSNLWAPITSSTWTFAHAGTSYINTFQSAASVYPSNAEQWQSYKNTSNVYSPSTTLNNVTLGSAPAPKGHYIISPFNQDRTTISGTAGLTTISTISRPSNGTWFQGRVWYTGVNSSFAATGTAPYTTWTESIYFSQVIMKTDDFGKCYQVNDPTSELLFDLLPTDGGVIIIQGSGPVFKLFPTQNGLLVFAANGVWYITGSQGIGFTANDYTVTKISSVQSISSTSYVDVLGLPYFWNEEGIYKVSVTQSGSLSVDCLTTTTILNFFSDIPLSCKKIARGSYNPIEYIIEWAYKDVEPTDVTDAYKFNRLLNYSTANQAFFPYTIDTTASAISSVLYVAGPGGSNTPSPMFKYFCSNNSSAWSFADLHDEDYVDWSSVNYDSYLVTGYKLRGQAIKKFQPQYVQIWSNTNDVDSGYQIQGVWDYAVDRNSNRYSAAQQAYIDGTDLFSTVYKRHKLRGNGYALQLKITSQDGKPFDLLGWAIVDTVNTGT